MALVCLPSEGSFLRVWRWMGAAGGCWEGVYAAVFEQKPWTPPPLRRRARGPAHLTLRPGRAWAGWCLASNHGLAFVALPNFWTLPCLPTLKFQIIYLVYHTTNSFLKFWRKIPDGTYITIKKATFWNSDSCVLVEWGRSGKEGVYY